MLCIVQKCLAWLLIMSICSISLAESTEQSSENEFAIPTVIKNSVEECSKPGSFQKENHGITFEYKGKSHYRNNSNLKRIIRKSESDDAKEELKKARNCVILIWTLPWLVVTLPAVSPLAVNLWKHRNAAIDYYNQHIYDNVAQNGCSEEYILYKK